MHLAPVTRSRRVDTAVGALETAEMVMQFVYPAHSRAHVFGFSRDSDCLYGVRKHKSVE